jgi:hypothetical protein
MYIINTQQGTCAKSEPYLDGRARSCGRLVFGLQARAGFGQTGRARGIFASAEPLPEGIHGVYNLRTLASFFAYARGVNRLWQNGGDWARGSGAGKRLDTELGEALRLARERICETSKGGREAELPLALSGSPELLVKALCALRELEAWSRTGSSNEAGGCEELWRCGWEGDAHMAKATDYKKGVARKASKFILAIRFMLSMDGYPENTKEAFRKTAFSQQLPLRLSPVSSRLEALPQRDTL